MTEADLAERIGRPGQFVEQLEKEESPPTVAIITRLSGPLGHALEVPGADVYDWLAHLAYQDIQEGKSR
jgi:transcriptional regulator with XRE-family HTH domain